MTAVKSLLIAAVILAGLMPAYALVAVPIGGGGGGGRGMPTPRPVPPPGYVYEWVGPLYQTITDRLWIADRTDLIPDWLETSPGRWEQVWRQVVIPGHWQTTTRQVLISPGYWRLARLDPPPIIVPLPPPRPVVIAPASVGVDGYRSGPGEDLSRFSPLSEWPK